MNDIDYIYASDGTGEAVRAIVTGTRSALATTLSVDSVNNWPASFIATVGTLNASTQIVEPASVTIFKGHLSGGDIIIDTIAPGYTDVGNTVGQVVLLKPTTLWADTLVASMKNIVADSITITGSGSAVGWNPIGIAQSGTIVANGNRSYSVPFATTVASVLTPGMRVRIPRTVTAPTQCTSLNGTTQYFNDTTVNGMTFTDDFTVSAWVKLSSYAGSTIMSRRSGNGWDLRLLSTGQVDLVGVNGANNRSARSFQSLPLNKWVHVAASLNMSAGTGEVYIDGVLVPSTNENSGSPVALVQAGNLEVGSVAGGNLFPGKIAQAAVFSSVLTAATIRSYMSQGLLGTESTLISAYSFNNSINDLNTTNANNLTAQGSAVATNADSPFAVDANGVAGGTNEFGIVTKVVTTTATIQVPEGCAIPTSGGVGSIDYATVATPFGFPKSTGKWEVTSLYKTIITYGTPNGAWINSNSVVLTIPVGSWDVMYSAPAASDRINFGTNLESTLSTSTSAVTVGELCDLVAVVPGTATGTNTARGNVKASASLETSASTLYYLLLKGTSGVASSLFLQAGSFEQGTIKATCAYL